MSEPTALKFRQTNPLPSHYMGNRVLVMRSDGSFHYKDVSASIGFTENFGVHAGSEGASPDQALHMS